MMNKLDKLDKLKLINTSYKFKIETLTLRILGLHQTTNLCKPYDFYIVKENNAQFISIFIIS